MKQYLYAVSGSEIPEEALRGISAYSCGVHASSVLFHLFCGNGCDISGIEHHVKKIKSTIPEAVVIGLSTGGEILHADLSDTGLLLSAFVFRHAKAQMISFRNILAREQSVGEELSRTVGRCRDLKGVELLFAGQDIDGTSVYEELKHCRKEVTFFGGYAADIGSHTGSDTGRAFLVTEEGACTDAMAAILYSGEELHIDAGRTTGWKPLGKSFHVTKADGRRLYRVDGTPAYDLYDKFLKFPGDESFTSYAKEFPLMLRKGKMKLLRHPQEKYEDASILLDGRVAEGDEICLSYGAPLEIIGRINTRCEKIRAFEPETILLYSCIGRKNFWGELIPWEMEPFQKLSETGGACLDAQIMRNSQTGRVIEHRLTLLSVAMREGPKTGRSIEKIQVDEEILKGRMSLVHRMSTLIESMMEELQKTNEILFGMNERLARANEVLQNMAITDELTGLYNRREIERRIREAVDRTKADHHPVTLVMLDIDFFKKVNDTYGHDIGDRVLKEIADILRESTDETQEEAAGRWGGEEFFILLPDKNMDEAFTFAERIRRKVEEHDFPAVRHLTVSMGVTGADAGSDYQAIFIRADQALYQAKQSGRNQVIRAEKA